MNEENHNLHRRVWRLASHSWVSPGSRSEWMSWMDLLLPGTSVSILEHQPLPHDWFVGVLMTVSVLLVRILDLCHPPDPEREMEGFRTDLFKSMAKRIHARSHHSKGQKDGQCGQRLDIEIIETSLEQSFGIVYIYHIYPIHIVPLTFTFKHRIMNLPWVIVTIGHHLMELDTRNDEHGWKWWWLMWWHWSI